MSNTYFDFPVSPYRFAARTKARAEDVNNRFDEVSYGFDLAAASILALSAGTSFVRATLADSITIGAGAKSFTLAGAGGTFAFFVGQWIYLIDPALPDARWMHGTISSFVPSTGAMVMQVTRFYGTGSIAAAVAVSATPTYDITVTGTAPVSVASGSGANVISILPASSGVNGYMTGAYATKLDGLVPLTVTGTAPISVANGATAPAISMAPASAGVNGYMTGTYATKLDGLTAGAAPGAVNFGYLNIPQNSKSAPYTLVLADAGKHIFHPSADTTGRVYTIPDNGSVAFPIGTAVTFINQNGAGNITISITTDTMRLAGAGTTGNRTLLANGTATAVKVATTEWLISGVNLA